MVSDLLRANSEVFFFYCFYYLLDTGPIFVHLEGIPALVITRHSGGWAASLVAPIQVAVAAGAGNLRNHLGYFPEQKAV